jgi:hypothetical protein
MKKPIGIALILGLLALAFAAMPAFAAAQPTLTENGEEIREGETVFASQLAADPVVTHTGLGTLECNNIELEGEVTENPGAEIGNGGGIATECEAAGNEVIIESIAFSDRFNEDTTDTADLAFTYFIPAINGHCFLESADVLTTWENESDVVEIDPSLLTGGGDSPFCPTEGTIEGSLTLETEDGTPVTVSGGI